MQAIQYLRLTALAAAIVLAGCSGGSSGDSSGATGSATLTISLMDAPVDDVTEVNVEITAIWLKSADESDGPAFELPLTDASITVDLLALTEENAAILVDGALIEPGEYEWLAMDVNAEFDNVFDSYVLNDTGGMEEIRVPSGRVRLVDGFTVEANQAVQLLFDWDLRKGLVDLPGQPGFLLKPAFRVIDVTEYGALSGVIALTTVMDPANDCNADVDDANYDTGNVVYIYAGLGVDPDDIDANDPEPVATVEAKPNTDTGDYEYRTLLAPGEYTVAFTCQAGNDDPEADDTGNADPLDDTVAFFASTHDVTMGGAAQTADF